VKILQTKHGIFHLFIRLEGKFILQLRIILDGKIRDEQQLSLLSAAVKYQCVGASKDILNSPALYDLIFSVDKDKRTFLHYACETNIKDFLNNYNSSYHSSIKKIPERLKIFDEVDLIRDSIAHNNKISNSKIKIGDFVRLLNKRGVFEKEGQRYTRKIYLVELRVQER
jgi:hypothetical protein